MRILFVQQHPDLRSRVLAEMLSRRGHACSLFHLPEAPATRAPELFTAGFAARLAPEDCRELAGLARGYDLLVCRVPSGELAALCAGLDTPCVFDATARARASFRPPQGAALLSSGHGPAAPLAALTVPTGLLCAHLPPPAAEAPGPRRIVLPATFAQGEGLLPQWARRALEAAGCELAPYPLHGPRRPLGSGLAECIRELGRAHAGLLDAGVPPDDGRLALLHAAGLAVLRPREGGAPEGSPRPGEVALGPAGIIRRALDRALALRAAQDLRDHAPVLDDAVDDLARFCEDHARPRPHVLGLAQEEILRGLPPFAAALPSDAGPPAAPEALAAGIRRRLLGAEGPGKAAPPLHLLADAEILRKLDLAAASQEPLELRVPLAPRSPLEDQCGVGERPVGWWLAELFARFEDVSVRLSAGQARFACRSALRPGGLVPGMARLAQAWSGATGNRLTVYRALWHRLAQALPWRGRVLFIGSNALCRGFYTAAFFGADQVVHVDPDPANAPDVLAFGEDLSAFADASVDGVAYFGTPYVMRSPAAFLREAARVLRPGGLLSGGFNGPAARWPGAPWSPAEDKAGQDFWTFAPADCLALLSPETLPRRLQRVGREYSLVNAVKGEGLNHAG